MAKEGKKGKKLEYDFDLFDQDEEAYRAYWESIQDKYPKKFAKAYWGTKYSDINHFHDYRILRFSMLGNSNVFLHTEDLLELEVMSMSKRGIYKFSFSKIYKVYCSLEVLDSNWRGHLFTDIVESRLGISEDGIYIFEFQTGWSKGRVRVDFGKVHVEERIPKNLQR